MRFLQNCQFAQMLRNDETIISSISVTDIFFDVYLGKWNYRAIPKVKTWSYFLTIPKYWRTCVAVIRSKSETNSFHTAFSSALIRHTFS